MNNRITSLLGVKYPIIQGGLYQLGNAPLVAAVAEAGAFGLITASNYENKQAMLEDIAEVKKQTDKPFGVNIAIGIRQNMDEFVEGVIESKVPVVFTSGYSPEQYMDVFKENHIKVVHVVPNVRFAQKAEELGCSAVVAVGKEGGGHIGVDSRPTMHLIPEVVKHVKIPVIASGGFYCGRGLAVAKTLGAEAVQMGTRFVMTKESTLHASLKDLFLKASPEDTLIIKHSIRKPNRVYKSDVAIKVDELENKGAPVEQLLPYIGGEAYKRMLETGDVNNGVISLGTCIGYIDDLPTVYELVENMMQEYNDTIQSFS